MEKNIEEKTGKSLAEWKTVLKKQQLNKHGEMMKFLKTTHNVTHGFANFIVLKYREADAGSADEETLIENQYKGKETLLPIFEILKMHGLALGKDVEIAPKKAAVSLRRKRQFALIKPATKTRIDLGLKFDDKPHGERLQDSGPFGKMCTHRVQLTASEEVDPELLGWLKEAYDEAK